MTRADWARLSQAGVPIETIATAAEVPAAFIRSVLREGKRAKNLKKTCQHCQQQFGRPKQADGSLLTPGEFAKRRYCSLACSKAAQQANATKCIRPDSPETKVCRNCERVFGPPYHMPWEQWRRRLYCTDACRLSRTSHVFAAARAPIAPQPEPPQVALFRILPPLPEPEAAAESDAEYLIRLCTAA